MDVYVRAPQLERPRRNSNAGPVVFTSLRFARDKGFPQRRVLRVTSPHENELCFIGGVFRKPARAKVIIEDFMRWFPRAFLLPHLPPSRSEFFFWNVQGFIAVEVELAQLRKLPDTRRQLSQMVSV